MLPSDAAAEATGRDPGGVERPHGRARRAVIGHVALGGLVVSGLGLALIAAAHRSPTLVNSSRRGYPDWMAGVFGHLLPHGDADGFYAVLMVMCACYLVVVACAGAISLRAAVASIVLLHLIFLLAPPLLSRDVFNYAFYGRLGVIHGLDPYVFTPRHAQQDVLYRYICCNHYPDPYGPLFTLISYALAHVGPHRVMWALKVIEALAGLGCLALVWQCARRLGRQPLPAIVYVGLSPIWLVFALGGGHNDLLMELFVLGGIAFWLGRRQAAGVASVAASVAVKVSGGVVLPFMVLGSDRRLRAVVVAGGSLAAVLALWLAAFGPDALRGWGGAINQQQEAFFRRSVPEQVSQLLGLGDKPTDGLRLAFTILLLVGLAWLLWRTWRGANWIVCAGWGVLVLLVTTNWLLPWYVVWLLPLSVLSGDRRLWIAGLVASAYVIWARTPVILG